MQGRLNTDKNKAVVLLKKLGLSMGEIKRAFEEKDKRNIYRIWHRDKDKYLLPSKIN